MKFSYAPNFKIKLHDFPKKVRKSFYKQAGLLLKDLRHPLLHAKKYDEPRGIWQARVNRNIRFYFLTENDTYILLDIKKHL